MRINRGSPEMQQAELASRVREPLAKPTPTGSGPAQPVAAVPRVDRVEISDAGRALAAQAGGTEASAEAGREMSPDRVNELRQRVLSGAYDSLAVVDQVARRMLQNGDV
jgi:negative regulator of flagellin synthesis FlgM